MLHNYSNFLLAGVLAVSAAALLQAQESKSASPETIGTIQALEAKGSAAPGKLAELERTPQPTELARFLLLPKMAVTAFDASDMGKAERYANELLSLAPKHRQNGNAVFFGKLILGRIALHRDHDVEKAKRFLLESASTKGSPPLNSFGPNMALAKDLLELGERETVLEFFGLCRIFWKSDSNKLDEWTAIVKRGGVPAFGRNLLYGS